MFEWIKQKFRKNRTPNGDGPEHSAENEPLSIKDINTLLGNLDRIGASSFADAIAKEKRRSEYLETRVSYDYWVLQAQIWEEQQQKALDSAIGIHAALYEKGASYNNVVLTLGYAGIFAVWNSVSDQVSDVGNAFLALLIGVSLVTFVTWTIFISVNLTYTFREYGKLANQELSDFQEQLRAHEKAEEKVSRASLKLQRLWPPVFILTITTAATAATFLFSELFSSLSGLDIGLDKAISRLFPVYVDV